MRANTRDTLSQFEGSCRCTHAHTQIKKEREDNVKEEEEEEVLNSKTGGMVFTTTMEFCRNLQSQEKKKPVPCLVVCL